MSQFDQLQVATKLRPPRLRDGLVSRRKLLDLLRKGRQSTLTLVCAPAGYGKTTLLADWLATDRERTPFAWVSLDASDSDPLRLWRHVLAALQSVHGRAGETSVPALAAGPHAISDTVIPRLIAELADCPECVLILDDCHMVRSPIWGETIGAFVERAPEAVQVVVSSRSDPDLPVPRLRAHGELTEIRARELRLSSRDAAVLFQKANLRLSANDVRRLTERTEGWLAGLALAILVLRQQEHPRRFVRDFAGDSRHVFDYLAHDVLDSAEPDVRDFMLRSSVLDHLNASLCDATLETSQSAATLAEIDSSNFFLVSLDEAGGEYRYHHLFEAMLRRELEAADPDSLTGLHGRASLWHEEHGDTERAIDHAVASRDVARASALVTRVAVPLLSTGRMATLDRWLESLSWPEALTDRSLALIRALAAGFSAGEREEIEHWLAIAEAGQDTGPLANGVTSLESGIAMVRSSYLSRGIAEAERGARLVLEREPAGSEWRYAGLMPLGQALFLAGRLEDARGPLEEARTLPGARRRVATSIALSYLALIELADGDTVKAERLARDALALAVENQHSTSASTANPHLALGATLMYGPNLTEAVDHIEQAARLAALAGSTYWYVHVLLYLAAARHRLGETAGARDALALARSELDSLPDTGMLEPLYHSTSEELLRRKRRDGHPGDELSAAELRVLREMVDGHSVAQTAQALWLSPNTVKTHRRSIYRKLGVHTREELAERSRGLGLLDDRNMRDTSTQ